MLEPVQVTLRATDFPSTGATRAARAGGTLQIWTTGHHVIAWIETHCVLTAADYIGKPFTLMPWQKRLLLELFEVVADDRAPGGWRRRHRWALIGIPKKNGKTELAAALALYFVVADEEGAPLVIAAAASDSQADLVFGAAKIMCEMSPTLKAITEPYQSEILVTGKPGAKIVRVAAASGTNDGKNIHVAVLDELHEWRGKRGEDVWNVLTNGTGARKQPMVIQITTAGSDEESIEYRQYEYGCRVRDGEVDDPRFYFYWIEPADPECDYRDLEQTRLVNPSWGVVLGPDFYEDQLTKKTEATYRRYFMNQHTEAEEIWEAAGLWDGLAGYPEEDPAEPLYVGVDVGLRNDSCAVSWCQWLGGEKVHVHQQIWENPFPRDDARHGEWKMSIVLVEKLLRELYQRFPEPAVEDEDEGYLAGPGFYYDPHFFARSAELLEGDGLNMVEFPQTDSRMVPASQRLFELVKRDELVHDGDPTMRRHVRSVVAKEKERGWRISKPTGSRRHIDAAIAAAIATYNCTEQRREVEEAPSVW